MRTPRLWFLSALAAAMIPIGLGLTRLPAAAVGAPPPQATPDPTTAAAFARGGCGGCHTVPGIPHAVGLVGPDLSRIGREASERRPGMSGEDYLRESILDPAAFVAPNCPSGACPAGVMPPNMGDRLDSSDLNLILAYLLTLTGADGPGFTGPHALVSIPIERPLESADPSFAEPPKVFENDAELLLGKYLFFDARLSADASRSCASCHRPELAWTDGKPLSDGYPGTAYFRNTPTLLNTAWSPVAYWDGRLEGAADMGTVVRDHITEAHFFQADGRLVVERLKQVPEYVQLFEDAYGGRVTFGRVLSAVSAYVLSLTSGLSPYDQYLAGDASALPAEAQAGMALFEGQAGCTVCHAGPTFSDYGFHALAVPENPEIFSDPLRHITFRRFFRTLGLPNYRATFDDVGRMAVTLEPAERRAFRTPPLREVALTPPYMHNGMLPTLEDVVRFYAAGTAATPALRLSDHEVALLVAFLESLSSEQPEVEVPILPGYQVRPFGENR